MGTSLILSDFIMFQVMEVHWNNTLRAIYAMHYGTPFLWEISLISLQPNMLPLAKVFFSFLLSADSLLGSVLFREEATTPSSYPRGVTAL